MVEISNNDLFFMLKGINTDAKEFIIEHRVKELKNRVTTLETEMKEMRKDIRKVDEKVVRLSAELLDAKADISILQKRID